MHIVFSDLEGVFVPEIWINLAEKTGIEAFSLTTRDIPDYNELMNYRLEQMRKSSLTIHDIHDVVSRMKPLAGAKPFLDWLRSVTQIIVLSDTFVEFTAPLMVQLNFPTLLCHTLSTDAKGRITAYHIRKENAKKASVEAFRELNYETIAMGDSYNDTAMLSVAHHGILFRPPENVAAEFPQFPVFQSYDDLRVIYTKLLGLSPTNKATGS